MLCQRAWKRVSLSVMGSLEAFAEGCISQDGLSSEQPLNPNGLRPRWTCHMQLNPDDGRLQAGFAIYVSYIHGASTGCTAHCPDTALTTGLRLMVLLLSGAHVISVLLQCIVLSFFSYKKLISIDFFLYQLQI